MESKAKLLGHAFPPMLIVFSLGLLATAVALDMSGYPPETRNAIEFRSV